MYFFSAQNWRKKWNDFSTIDHQGSLQTNSIRGRGPRREIWMVGTDFFIRKRLNSQFLGFHIPSHAAYALNHRPDSRVWCFMGYPPWVWKPQMHPMLWTPRNCWVSTGQIIFHTELYRVFIYNYMYIYIVMYIIYIVIYSYVYYIYSYIYMIIYIWFYICVCVQYVFIYIYTIHVCKWINNGFAAVDFRTPRAWPFSRPSTSPARPSWHAAWNRVAGSSGTGQIWGSSLGWANVVRVDFALWKWHVHVQVSMQSAAAWINGEWFRKR